MSGQSSEKSFDAPPSRVAKARREGNVPRAQEFSANLAFAGAALATTAVAPLLGAWARAAIVLAAHGTTPVSCCVAIAALGLAPIAAAAGGGVLGGLLQSGGLVVVAPVAKFERLSPAEGFKRMLSRETLTHGMRALVAFALSSVAMLPTLRDLASASSASLAPGGIAPIAWSGAQHVVFTAVAVGLLFACAEYAVARRTWLRRLRMSLAELRRELKESDGDPLARSRRRALHSRLVRGALTRVKDAAFVVVNPTHVAVALEYRPPAVPVPTVLVCAADALALRVRELAAASRIPVIENVALARALYRDGMVGRPIEHEHYVAVAEIVGALIRSGALDVCA